ncbi:prokaryotic molybdopterin-containing oxidoreductase family, iron-sulfur binding subunit [Muriicola jejuensis]|uniref:4Fe-4S dicluster domain-containing protein n=1 Tax=Muriicola jejuensis TaxID=504488 RepID=A0A6P0UC82_9FLAO|nr:4Fe-4S dicluster domain-containing protein [Muriicola jejuensis]NER10854.1 4Fe-4S dicluster domain-containing protein [Muriicola jejuensis]SMP15925.1 prokaryotic molybdopterin-containing oxidoreductase family, iron-sulfur binding subunit [Muriicola jejuensis]
MDENNKKTRRKFLDRGLKLGVAGVLGGIGLSKLSAKFAPDDKAPTGETMELMTTDGTIVEIDTSEVMEVEHHHHYSMDYNVREGIPNRKFVMVVDLAKCKNALKCQQSCNKNHYITGDNAWLKVYKMQESADTAPYWLPTMCQHCDKPACVTVCPVDATFKREDGLVLIDNERCIGCRFCMAACPYSTRVFNWGDPGQEVTLNMDMTGVEPTPEYAGRPSLKGTVDKCDFCPHMVKEGELPHCVTACPNGVFYFGDKYEDTVTNGEETLRLSKLLEDKAGYRLLESLGTEPSVYYLPPVDRLVDFEEGMSEFKEFESVEKPSEE